VTDASIPQAQSIEATILALAGTRGGAGSICPSEVARALAPEDWRKLLGAVRRAAAGLAAAGRIDILRKGRPVDPAGVRGVIRLRIRPDGDGAGEGVTES
jgi:Protein of unknown function (DUF3253)